MAEATETTEAKEFLERFCVHMQNLTTAMLQQAQVSARLQQQNQILARQMGALAQQLADANARMDYAEPRMALLGDQITQLVDQTARLARAIEEPVDHSPSSYMAPPLPTSAPGPLRWPGPGGTFQADGSVIPLSYGPHPSDPYTPPPGSQRGGRGRPY